MEEEEENGMQDIEAFEKKLKNHRGEVLDDSGSSSDEHPVMAPISGYPNENVKLQTKVKLLIKQLVDKDKEIESLRAVLGYVKSEPEESDLGGDFRDQKLRELAKKNRSFQVMLESEKNRAARAMEEVHRLREEAAKKETTKGWNRNSIKEEAAIQKTNNVEKQFQELQQKYTYVKDELKKAKTILKREIGDFDNLESLMKNETWKGRAQQIELMKSRINELKRQIAKKPEEPGTPAMNTIKTEVAGTGTADERRKEIQSLQEQLAKTREELEKTKKKMQGASSRMVALEKEAKELRETHKVQVKTLLDKAENDDKFIEELKNEIERVRKIKGLVKAEPVNNNKEISQLKWEIANLHQRLHNTQQELQEKADIIDMFKNVGEQDGIENEVEYKERIKELEQQVAALKQNEKKIGNTEDGRMIKDISSQNARLRNKVNQLEEELSKIRMSNS